MPIIVPETPGAGPAIDRLLDQAFGWQRHQKTAQRLRDGQVPARGLAFVAIEDGDLVGTIRFWSLSLGDRSPALLLGPIAIERRCQGCGLGSDMIRHGLHQARRLGHIAVILVGDEPYYRRFGFSAALTCGLLLPGPVDRRRFLGLELVQDALAGARGMVSAMPASPTPRVRLRVA